MAKDSLNQISGKVHNVKDPAPRILIVEDEVIFARAAMKQLSKSGYECEHAETIEDALLLTKQFTPDVVLTDMRLPDGIGADQIPYYMSLGIAVVVITAMGEVSDAVNAIKLGAADYLKKPVDLDELVLVIEKARSASSLQAKVDYAHQRSNHGVERVEMIGDSPVMQEVKTQIARIAKFASLESAAPPAILITGETGTGKDVAARLIHQSYTQPDKPFVHVDCASLPADLIENELFGHEKGSFTSAIGTQSGLIEAAEDGTLFLDEVGELPLQLQSKLLNVLERRMVRRLGSTKERPVSANFIAATNRDLQQMVIEGKFRSDLYYRLNVLTIKMPPLRERGDDIVQLIDLFIRQTERKYGLSKKTYGEQAMKLMRAYDWPGNVRELKHQVSRCLLLSQNNLIMPNDLVLPIDELRSAQIFAQSFISTNGTTTQMATMQDAEKAMIVAALDSSNANVSEAARKLGITRMAMRYRMEKLGLSK